jgi:hypothetical protein
MDFDAAEATRRLAGFLFGEVVGAAVMAFAIGTAVRWKNGIEHKQANIQSAPTRNRVRIFCIILDIGLGGAQIIRAAFPLDPLTLLWEVELMRTTKISWWCLVVGVLLNVVSRPAIASTTYNVDLTTQAAFGNLNQHDVPGCGDFACGPTAAVNSFVFLQNKYPSIYDTSLVPHIAGNTPYQDEVAAAQALQSPNYMNCTACNGGTLLNDFINGKRKWIEDHVPGKTVYKDSAQSNWPFLYNELNAMEDVELLVGFYDANGNRIGGHYVTLSSFHWVDQNMDGIINGNETATIDFVDPDNGQNKVQRLFSQSAAGQYSLTTDYGVGGVIGTTPVATTGINWAISESPVPEPASIVLFVLGSCGLVRYRRRFRTQ